MYPTRVRISPKLTEEQKMYRQLAREASVMTLHYIKRSNATSKHIAKLYLNHVYISARQAARFAFEAHPELRVKP